MKTLIICCTCILAASDVRAQDCNLPYEARKHMAFAEKEMERATRNDSYYMAITEYEAVPDCPAIVYRLGTLYRKIGGTSNAADMNNAVKFLKLYIALAPMADNVKEVEKHIFDLEWELERLKPKTMTMTTAKSGRVAIYLAGTGDAIIDWDDGSAETVTLPKSDNAGDLSAFLSFRRRCDHIFSDTTSRTITINGLYITNLFFGTSSITDKESNKTTETTPMLTSLDIS